MRHTIRTLLSTALVPLLASSVGAGLVIVDPTGVGEPALRAAIDAAVDGDVLLLKPGDYLLNATSQYLTIDGKGITLIAEGARPVIRQLQVVNLPAGRQVIVRGITVDAVSQDHGLDVQDCAGAVWIEDCTLRGNDEG